jgi:hypothetical protein
MGVRASIPLKLKKLFNYFTSKKAASLSGRFFALYRFILTNINNTQKAHISRKTALIPYKLKILGR